MAILLVCLSTACGDDEAAKTPEVTSTSTSSGETTTPTKTTPTETTPATTTPPPSPHPIRLDASIAAPRPIYRTGLRVAPQAVVWGSDGVELEDPTVTWTVSPPEIATLREDIGLWELEREGTATFEACTTPNPDNPNDTEPVCGQTSIVVDDARPIVTITSPTPGSELRSDEFPTITVTGTASDTHGTLLVFVQGEPVPLNDDGSFSHTITPRLGLNHIDVSATDSIQPEETIAVAEVLWGHDFLPTPEPNPDAPNTSSLSLPSALHLRLGQNFLDDQTPLDLTQPTLLLQDLADILAFGIYDIDFTSQLDPVISDTETLSLEITDLDIPLPDVSASFTEQGADLFIRLQDVAITTEGNLTVEETSLNLNGVIFADISAFAHITIAYNDPDTPPTISVDTFNIALEDAQSQFVSGEANAIFNLAESALRGLLEQTLLGILQDPLQDTLPTLLSDALSSISSLLNQSFDLDVSPLPPTQLNLQGSLTSLQPTAQQHLHAQLDVLLDVSQTANNPDENINPPQSRGVLTTTPLPRDEEGTLIPPQPPLFQTSRVQLAVRLALVNGLLHTLWRSGLLNLDLTSILPDSIAGIVQEAQISSKLPPVLIEASPDFAQFNFVISIGQLEFTAQLLGQTDTYGVSLETGVNLTFQASGLTLNINPEPTIRVWPIRTDGTQFTFTRADLARIIETQVSPLLLDALSENITVPIPPLDLAGLSDISPRLSELELLLSLARPLEVREGFIILDTTLEGSISNTADF